MNPVITWRFTVPLLVAALLAPPHLPAGAGPLGDLMGYLKGTAIESPEAASPEAGKAPDAPGGTARRIEPGVDDPLTRDGLDNPSRWLGKLDYGRLISDFAMENVACMDEADIQALFERNGSVLARPIDGEKPAAMILAAARKHGISPKVLCATLQKEQGLVTRRSATRAKLDWALGVGVFDGGRRLAGYKGFARQVEGAAATLRKLFDANKAKFDAGARTVTFRTLEGDVVQVRNAATLALFQYTPHLAGNRLFHQVYRRFEERGWRGWSDPKSFDLVDPAKPRRIE